jgi:hypothetical protein
MGRTGSNHWELVLVIEINAEDRIELHGRICALVLEGDGVRIDDLPLAGDHDHRPWQLAVDELLK